MATKKKNSLVNNINKRKKAGNEPTEVEVHRQPKGLSGDEKGWPKSDKS